MRLLNRLLIATALLSLTATVLAQDTVPYRWDATGMSLSYPAAWNEPLPDEQNGQLVLQLAQVLVETPPDIRPPGVPMIRLTLFPAGMPQDGNLLPFLYADLQNLGIDTPDESTDATLLGEPASQLTGMSADGQLFGIAQVTAVGDTDVLVVTGRAVEAQQDDFLTIFEGVASSISTSGVIETEPATADETTYGVLWYTQRNQADGEDAFLNLAGLDVGPDDMLYTYEPDLGVVQIDAATGSIRSITPNDHIFDPTDIAVAGDGTVYVADIACACIFTLMPDGTWLDREGEFDDTLLDFDPETNSGIIGGFSDGAPAHLAVDSAGVLYATNISDAGAITVLAFENRERRRTISLGGDVTGQPPLSAAPSGEMVALTNFGDLLTLSGADAAAVGTPLSTPTIVAALAVLPDGNLVVAAQGQGISIVTPDGEIVEQPGILVPDAPQPGEMVSPVGVAADARGRVYVADSDGTFGAIMAMSTGVPSDRIGASDLTPDLVVQGILSEQTQQTWTYAGTAGQHITLTAVDNAGSGAVDVALHLIDPAGAEVASNDDHESVDLLVFSDAQIFDYALAASGEYTIIVEAMQGEGAYSLGLTLNRQLTFDASGAASASGQLSAAFPVNVWEFSGSAGQTFTMTLQATSGTLDTILRLMGPDGSLLAENDDADDITLGPDSQLVGVSLPADGTYRVEAARFDGSGEYMLSVAPES